MPKNVKPPIVQMAAEMTPPTNNEQMVPWIKATVDQKIERLHFVVKDMIKALNTVQKKADKTHANLFNHKHVGEQLMQIMSQFEASVPEPEDKRTDEERWF